jgi:hypothetical protein
MSSQDKSSTSEVSIFVDSMLNSDLYHLDILLVGLMMKLHSKSLMGRL